MKNQLIDLNNHLFAQLERLADESLSTDKLKHEIERSKAIQGLAGQVVSNASLALQAKKAIGERLINEAPGMMLEAKPL